MLLEEEAESTNKILHKKKAYQYPQLWMGMIGIFVYVGVEVSTASNLPEYLIEKLGIRYRKKLLHLFLCIGQV
jgi:FHS family L-fucose permease-like MFS transporter